MEKVEQPAERAGFSIYLFEAILVAASGGVGLIGLIREGSPTALSILVMLALPLAGAVVAGSLGRLTIEGRTNPHWSAALTLPTMHAATLFALAKLIEEANTGIQTPEGIVSSLLWVDPRLILLSAGAQVMALSVMFALLRKK